ncbi:hypothetical protein C8N47_1095 [Mangrovibacterium marinum]|uniref:Uncharacterized protein n=1 Tax=Mangrovibacterium marinum TaxID=1639118 RepID=A0A2T5C0Y4_9BACT|nr:hypothetical protein C8N47_1095 [Mangrovibacterium marinum]
MKTDEVVSNEFSVPKFQVFYFHSFPNEWFTVRRF